MLMSAFSSLSGMRWMFFGVCLLMGGLFVHGVSSAGEPSAPKKRQVVAPEKASAPQAATTTAQSKQAESAAQATALPPLLVGLYIFLLAIFVGFELITKVPPTLHTPLMSGANAISGITIVGALYCARFTTPSVAKVLGFVAVLCAMINVVGGFLVTDRLLQKFKK